MAQTYKSQIMSWDWEQIVKDCKREDAYEGAKWEFLGTVFSLTPSGKYYTPFANSNVTESEANKDEAWFKALEEVASKYGGYIEPGEGDPCDLFFCLPADDDETDE